MCRALACLSILAVGFSLEGCEKAALVPVAAGQDKAEPLELSPNDRFKFFNACRPMVLLVGVEVPGDDAIKVGLITERLQAAAESRLRAARLYTEKSASDMRDEGGAILSVIANVQDEKDADGLAVYAWKLEYWKLVTDEFGVSAYAVTWENTVFAAGGVEEANYIVSDVLLALDLFIAAYLVTNGKGKPACPAPPPGFGSRRQSRPSCEELQASVAPFPRGIWPERGLAAAGLRTPSRVIPPARGGGAGTQYC